MDESEGNPRDSDRTCSVDGCPKPLYAKGLCGTHYARVRNTGSTELRSRKVMSTCHVDGCDGKAIARHLCAMHYARFKRTGFVGASDRLVQSREGACSVDGCEDEIYAKGWCGKHYNNNLYRGDPLAVGPTQQWRLGERKWDGVLCVVDGCEREVDTAGYCSMHYNRLQKHGDPGQAARINGEFGSGYVDSNGYRWLPDPRQRGRRDLEHRLVIEQLLGRPLLPGENVHHINGQRADNRVDGPLVNGRSGNLELWSTSQPPGQHIEDKVRWAREIVELYGSIVD